MAGPIAIDTPDYQRGIVNAQKLLATVPAGTQIKRVGVPPNTETIIVVTAGIDQGLQVTVNGVTSGGSYKGVKLATNGASDTRETWFFDAASALDTQVDVSVSVNPVGPWYIYGDAGVHVMADASAAGNYFGQKYVIPSVPNTGTGDHPPAELRCNGGGVTATGLVLGPPGVGLRYRVFALQLAPWTGTLFGLLEDNNAAEVLLAGGPGAPGQLQIPLTGLPLSTNGPLGFTAGGGAGEMIVVVYYTTETV